MRQNREQSLAVIIPPRNRNDDIYYENSHRNNTSNHSKQRPLVQIVETSSSFDDTCSGRYDRGRILVSVDTSSVMNNDSSSGNAKPSVSTSCNDTVLYTERAAVAVQIHDDTAVKACQYCFRCLEPIVCVNWPESYRWLVPTKQCKCGGDCDYIFCHSNCQAKFRSQYGSCCLLQKSMKTVPLVLHQRYHCDDTSSISKIISTELLTDDGGAAIEYDNDDQQQQPAVVLAVRMFVMKLHSIRRSSNTNDSKMLDGLCGAASDITPLEVGCYCTSKRRINVDDGNATSNSYDSDNDDHFYTVDPIYDMVVHIYNMTESECTICTATVLATYVARAARNGFAIQTQSPFQSYYTGLVRSVGRNTKQHAVLQQQIAAGIQQQFMKFVTHDATSSSSSSSVITREMNAIIEKYTTVQIVGIFPLTSNINHACGDAANTYVQGKNYIDCHIDIMSSSIIQYGTELQISYIPSLSRASSNTKRKCQQRQNQLYAKYMFHCNCTFCSNAT